MDDLWRSKVRVEVMGKTLWMRALSDAEVQERDESAMYASIQRRRLLEDVNSKEHAIYIDALEHARDADLKAVILRGQTIELQRQAQEDVKPRFFTFPDNATEQEKAGTIKNREDDATRVTKERTEYVTKAIAAFKEKIGAWTHEQLVAKAREMQIVAQTLVANIRSANNFTVFKGIYTDEECVKPLVASEDLAEEIPSAYRNQLIEKYWEEMGKISILDIEYLFKTADLKESVSPSSLPVSDPKTLEPSP